MIRITGTFLDEISHDIPHQNWGRKEWDMDFHAMKSAGIDKVILIRCGHRKWVTYPSKVLKEQQNTFTPPVDLVEMFLELADKYDMSFFFGTYDSGEWHRETRISEKEFELSYRVIDEAWSMYGKKKAFKGWYVNNEISRRAKGHIELIARVAKHCKDISGGLPVLISPYFDGAKNVYSFDSDINRNDGKAITPEQHDREWDEIMAGIRGFVDIVAFQDGHVDFSELEELLAINKKLTDKHGLECWTNTETFDRDMPIKFTPIKFEKLLIKLNAAEKAGIKQAITFEFSHFMSPNSMWRSASHLYERYREYLKASMCPK